MIQRTIVSAVLAAILVGCGSKPAPTASVDEFVQKKIDWMNKLADAVNSPNQENAVRFALEKFRNIPFQPKSQPEATAKILEIYKTRVAGRLQGEDIALEVDQEMQLIEKQLN